PPSVRLVEGHVHLADPLIQADEQIRQIQERVRLRREMKVDDRRSIEHVDHVEERARACTSARTGDDQDLERTRATLHRAVLIELGCARQTRGDLFRDLLLDLEAMLEKADPSEHTQARSTVFDVLVRYEGARLRVVPIAHVFGGGALAVELGFDPLAWVE